MHDLLHSLPSRAARGLVNVVIDTPKGSRNKFKYDAGAQCFRLSRILPAGASFPYDFGSVPQTIAEDGDALDVMVLGEAPSFAGCLIVAKLIGGISAKQTEKGVTIRNDRLLAVPVTKANPAAFSHIDQLRPALVAELEHFFVSYNKAHGREFRPLGRLGPQKAEKALATAAQRYARKRGRA